MRTRGDPDGHASDAVAERAERRRAPAAPRPFGRRDVDRVDLTARQREVLDLAAEGYENKEIAGRLGISEQAVKQQVSVLLKKFRVGSRAVLATTAMTMRLLGRASREGVSYEYLFDRAPVMIAMSRGPRHELALVNPAFVRFFGERDYIGRTFTECFPEASAHLRADLEGVVARGEPWVNAERRLRLVSPAGVEREVFLSLVAEPTRDASGAIDGIVFYAWDLTEQVATRRKLHRLSAEQEVLLQQLPVGVVYTDALARPVMVNPTARRILGGTFDPGRPLYAQFDGWNVRLVSTGASLTPDNAPSATATRGWPFDEEVLVRTRSGREARIHVSARPLHDEHGAVSGAVLVLTERAATSTPGADAGA